MSDPAANKTTPPKKGLLDVLHEIEHRIAPDEQAGSTATVPREVLLIWQRGVNETMKAMRRVSKDPLKSELYSQKLYVAHGLKEPVGPELEEDKETTEEAQEATGEAKETPEEAKETFKGSKYKQAHQDNGKSTRKDTKTELLASDVAGPGSPRNQMKARTTRSGAGPQQVSSPSVGRDQTFQAGPSTITLDMHANNMTRNMPQFPMQPVSTLPEFHSDIGQADNQTFYENLNSTQSSYEDLNRTQTSYEDLYSTHSFYEDFKSTPTYPGNTLVPNLGDANFAMSQQHFELFHMHPDGNFMYPNMVPNAMPSIPAWYPPVPKLEVTEVATAPSSPSAPSQGSTATLRRHSSYASSTNDTVEDFSQDTTIHNHSQDSITTDSSQEEYSQESAWSAASEESIMSAASEESIMSDASQESAASDFSQKSSSSQDSTATVKPSNVHQKDAPSREVTPVPSSVHDDRMSNPIPSSD